MAISPDRPPYTAETGGELELDFQLASDPELRAARAFGVAFDVGREGYTRYRDDFGLDLRERSGADHTLLPVPAVFVVGSSGRVYLPWAHPDYRQRLHPDVILAAARAAVE